MSNTNYKSTFAKVQGITDGIPYVIANLSNISAILYEDIPGVNWAGFYMVEDGSLILGPFQGKVACIKIEKGKGVCGTAYEKDETQVIKNVHEFPGHIACDAASNSEIVVPIHKNGEVIGVLDIDSSEFENFDENDKDGLERIVSHIETFI